MSSLKRFLEWLLQFLCPNKIVGITVKENPLTQKAQCKIIKKSTTGQKAAQYGLKALSVGTFNLLDNGSGVFTTMGVDQSGNQVDISSVATEAVESDNSAVTVSPPAGMAVTITAPATGTGTANLTFTATWNDGSVGPFTFVAVVNYDGGSITGITVVETPVTPQSPPSP
jgi:hypothetical protein